MRKHNLTNKKITRKANTMKMTNAFEEHNLGHNFVQISQFRPISKFQTNFTILEYLEYLEYLEFGQFRNFCDVFFPWRYSFIFSHISISQYMLWKRTNLVSRFLLKPLFLFLLRALLCLKTTRNDQQAGRIYPAAWTGQWVSYQQPGHVSIISA